MAFKITTKEIWAIVLAISPFILRFGSRATVNGVVQYDYNYVGVVAGVLAIVVTIIGVVTLKRDIAEQPPMLHYLLLGASALLGLYQLLQGASII